MVLIHSQSDQVFAFPLRLLPVMPDPVPKPVSQPLIDGLQLGMDTRKAVIVYPPPPYFCKLFQPFFEAVRFGFLGNWNKTKKSDYFQPFPSRLGRASFRIGSGQASYLLSNQN
jgi:hypothetical protein